LNNPGQLGFIWTIITFEHRPPLYIAEETRRP
jgi:hypothetical protein